MMGNKAAGYVAVLHKVYAHRGRGDEFDRWYAELVQTYHRFHALNSVTGAVGMQCGE